MKFIATILTLVFAFPTLAAYSQSAYELEGGHEISQTTMETSSEAEGILGSWIMEKLVKGQELDEFQYAPYPESIQIEMTDEESGVVTIKLSRQKTKKVYNFKVNSSLSDSSVQNYEKYVDENPEYSSDAYSLEEKVEVFHAGETITIVIKWTQRNKQGEVEWTVPGVYQFSLTANSRLLFNRTNGKNDEQTGENQSVYKAIYKRVRN